MVFSNFVFVCYFLPLVVVAYYSYYSRVWRNTILLIASLAFYSWGEPIYVLLMVMSICINWKLALNLYQDTNCRLPILVIGIILNLIGIWVFKYSGFFVTNLNLLFSTNINIPEIALPIGISFYTFQAISYLVDVYRKKVEPQRNPFYFGTYLSMFPQLIAGPIVRYETIEKELMVRHENLSAFNQGLRRFIVGLAKKLLIANTMGKIADTILILEPHSIGLIPAWYAFIAYTFQIYFDFSGYSDMAIGLGKMFGFQFIENFNYPYISKSITEFWRRWHISLSSFFRDYVYIPLGGNQVRRFRWIFNLIVVWALTGLWHGASWNFLCWGFYYGMILIGEKLLWGRLISKAPTATQHVYTCLLIVFGWVVFRVENLSQIASWALTLIGYNGVGSFSTLNFLNVIHLWPWFVVAIIGSTPLVKKIARFVDNESTKIYLLHHACMVGLFVISMVKLATGGFNPFIYFRF